MATSIAGAMDLMHRRMFGPQGTVRPGAGAPASVLPAQAGAGAVPAVPRGPRMQTGLAAQPPRPQPALADDSVTSQFNRITAAGSPLIAMGQQAGLNLANRRGLLNSNIALGSAMAEGYKAALPLAQQEAQTAAAKNLAAIDNQAQMRRLRLSTGSAERMQGSDIAAQRERLQISNDAQMAQLERQLAGASAQQQVEIRAQMDRLRETNVAEMARLERSGQLDTAARAQQGLIQGQLQSDQNAAEMARLQTSLSGATAQQQADIRAQMERLREANIAEAARLAQQSQIQTGLNAQQNAAEMQRLQANLASANDQQKADIVAQMERLRYGAEADNVRQQRDLASREIMQQREFANLNEQQKQELASRSSLLIAELRSRADLQTQSLGSTERQQAVQIAAQQAMQSAEFAHLDTAQKADLAAQMARLVTAGDQTLQQIVASGAQDRVRIELQGKIDTALQSSGADQQQKLASLQGDIASKLQSQQDIGQLQRLNAQFAHDLEVQKGDNDAKLRQIAATGDQEIRRLVEAGLQERDTLAMNLAAGDRQQLAASMLSIFNAEAQLRGALLGNPQMPASERAAYERAISGMGDPLRNYINQLYAPPPPPAQAPVPAPQPGEPAPAFPGGGGGGLIQAPGLGAAYDPGQVPYAPVYAPVPQLVPPAPLAGGGGGVAAEQAGLLQPGLSYRLQGALQ